MQTKIKYGFLLLKEDGSPDKSAILSRLLSLDAFSSASSEDLRVLIALLESGADVEKEALSKIAHCEIDEIDDAIQFWRGAGILGKAQKKSSNKEEPKTEESKKPLRREDRVSSLNSKELASSIKRKNLSSLIDACQQTAGKVMTTAEVNIIVGLHDELSLSGEYILMLVHHCYENDKRSMKYVEKMAFSLCDSGILSASDLEIYLEEKRKFASFEWQLKKMFGLGERDFTKKQASFVSKWEKEYGISIEILGLAYDITVDSINKADFSYIDKILTSWHENGLKTEKEILAFEEKAKEERKSKTEKEKKPEKNPKSSVGYNSFDVDDFFSRAVERSYKKK
jgi:DnaD/phage-associated family protein